VDVWYELVRPDGRTGRSGHVLISVISGASQTWPMPEVWDASDKPVNPLNPVKAGTSDANTATVVVRDARLSSGDYVGFVWAIAGGNSEVFHKDVNAAGEVHAELPVSVFAASLGKTVAVSYVVYKGGAAQPLSQVLNLRVLELPATALKAPRFVEATGIPLVLDLNAITSNATVVVDPWPLIAEGQTFWLRMHGTRDDGDPYSERLATPYTVQTSDVTSGIHRVVERSLLLRLENASTLRVELKVDLSGTVLESAATSFPEGVFEMNQLNLVLPAPTVENELNGYLNPVDIPGYGVKITLPIYTGIEKGQWVGLEWTAVDPVGSLILPMKELMSVQKIEFILPKATAVLSAGRAVSVAYTVQRAQGGLPKTSTPVPFEIAMASPINPPNTETFENVPAGSFTRLYLDHFTVQMPESTVASITENPPIEMLPYITGKSIKAQAPFSSSDITLLLKPGCTYLRLGCGPTENAVDIQVYMSNGSSRMYQGSIRWFEVDNGGTLKVYITHVVFRMKRAAYLYLDNIATRLEMDP